MRRYRLLLHAFPKAWRAQYGKELLRVLEDDPSTPRWPCVDLLRAGLQERAHCLALAVRGRCRTKSAEVTRLRSPGRPRVLGRWAAAALPVLLAVGIASVLATHDGGASRQRTVPRPGAAVSTSSGRPILPVRLAGNQSRRPTEASRRDAVAAADRSAARAAGLVAERRGGGQADYGRGGVASADSPSSG